MINGYYIPRTTTATAHYYLPPPPPPAPPAAEERCWYLIAGVVQCTDHVPDDTAGIGHLCAEHLRAAVAEARYRGRTAEEGPRELDRDGA